ncbi:MAG: hypothetical protein ABFE01_10780 [Phycisphaerales bacterium]
MRDSLVKAVFRCVMPLSLVAFLCSCQSTARTAVGLEGGGQRIISNEYAKMWHLAFSEEQWLQLLRQRVHQPIALWQGVDSGSVGEGYREMSFQGLTFRDSQSLVLENHLESNDLMLQHPLLFVRLFDDQDPETVLTGVAAYRLSQATRSLDPAVKEQIAEAFRLRLLSHLDVRVRWAAIQTLAQNGWLTPQDIERGFNDETNDIRVTTAFWMPVVRSWLNERPGTDALDGTTPHLTPQQVHDWQALLAPILLEHLNDSHFFVRHAAGRDLRCLFEQRLHDLQGTGGGQDGSIALPERLDWVESDWQARCEAQKAWRQWWADHGTAPAL